MLDVLHDVEVLLPQLIQDVQHWNTLYVGYHPPFVERVWMQWHEFRILLHRISPCTREQALFHPHPWPSAVRVQSGLYEMGIGYGAGDEAPPIAARVIMGPGALYEMTDPDGWHYVRPIGGPTMSLMVIGEPWNRISPKSDVPLGPLDNVQRTEILAFSRAYYGDRKK